MSAILGIALVAVSGIAIHLSREVDAGRQKIAAFEARLVELQGSGAPAARANAQVQRSADSAEQQPRAAEQSPPPPAASVLLNAATLRAQMSSPEAMARRKESNRYLIRTSHPGVEEALGLAPAELEKLLELLSAQQDRSSEIFEKAREQGNQAASQATVAAGLDEHRRASEAELQELLGAKYPQWQDYQQTRSAWTQGRDLRAVLEAAGTPFTPTQERALISALAAEQRSFNQTSGVPGQSLVLNSPERQRRRLDAAAPHLSPQQLESYREMMERAAAQQRILMPTPPDPASSPSPR
ncbi:MAG: hypothetical protein M3Y79_05745 [Pseudomonadota bacterium]|nr:hypothetical protein [Pseudomonadota bacterium]